MKKQRPQNIPKNAQLISGIGSSSWFTISLEKEKYRIERFSEDGVLECSRIFIPDNPAFNINQEYQFTYLSHCQKCTIIQNNSRFLFFAKKE